MSGTFISLFAGIGGLDYAFEAAGFACGAQVENDPWCVEVLTKLWPNVPKFGDVKEVGAHNLPAADLIVGGFPCQPISNAGKRLGKDDLRWLWPEFARIVGELRPSYVFVENVASLRSMDDGQLFGTVLGDLAALGYDAEWDCIPASAVGAPHERDRVWILAYAQRPERGTDALARRAAGRVVLPREQEGAARLGAGGETLADADLSGLERRLVQPERANQLASGPSGMADPEGERGELRATEGERSRRPSGGGVEDADSSAVEPRRWRGRASEAGELADPTGAGRGRTGSGVDGDALGAGPLGGPAGAGEGGTQPGMGGGADGLSARLDGHRWPAPPGPPHDWEPPRIALGIPKRNKRLKGLGNAVVPQVPYRIALRLAAYIRAMEEAA